MPFRGIEPFRYSDSLIFFARDAETRSLLHLVVIYRGVLLYGESGTGKSSLVNAGLIPDAIDEDFRVDRIRVQPRTGEELVVERIRVSDDNAAFLPSSFADEDDKRSRIVLSTDDFRTRLRGLDWNVDPSPLLIFDQFEELITLFEQTSNSVTLEGAQTAQASIVALLVELLRDTTLPVKLVFGFREDYLAKVKALFARCPELLDQSLRLTPPTTAALDSIIRGPFEEYSGHFGSELSPKLAERLAEKIAVRTESGVLNLSEVEVVCLRLWRSKDPARLLQKKGVQGLLEDYLTEALDRFPEEDRSVAVAVLSEMVTAQGTRNVVAADDLIDHVRSEEDVSDERARRVLMRLEVEAKLIRRELRHDIYLYEIDTEIQLPWISQQREERLQARARRDEAQRQARARRKLGLFAAGLLVLAAVLAALGFMVWNAKNDAENATKAADANKQAEKALLQLGMDPKNSVRLALGAVKPEIPETEGVLRIALAESHERVLLRGGGVGSSFPEPALYSVAFSPSGKLVVTAGADGTARIWNAATGASVAVLGRPGGLGMKTASFSPDGKFVLALGQDGTARIWNAENARPLGAPLRRALVHDAKSPDATLRPGLTSAAFDPRGRLVVAAGGDGTTWIWKVATHSTVAVLRPEGPRVRVNSASFSPSGRRVVTADADGTAHVWDVTTAKPVATLGQGGDLPLSSAAFNPDGTSIVTASADGTARIYEALTARETAVFGGHIGAVTSAAFSPDGSRLVTASADGTARVWDVKTREVIAVLRGHRGSVSMAAFSPDGKLVATASADGTARVWDSGVDDIRAVLGRVHDPAINSVVFSPDGKLVITGSTDGTARVWGAAGGKPRRTLRQDGDLPVDAAAFRKDDKLVLTAGVDGTVRVWEVQTGKIFASLGEQGDPLVYAAAFSGDGKRVIAIDADGRLQQWAFRAGGSESRQLKVPGLVTAAAFSPDGTQLVTAGRDGTAHVWEAATGDRVTVLGKTGDSSVSNIAFSADGSMIVTSHADGKARVWETDGAKESVVLEERDGFIDAAAFSPDGALVVTANSDGTASVWQTGTGVLLTLLRGHSAAVTSVAFDPVDSTRVATASQDGTARIHVCAVCADIETLKKRAKSVIGKEGN